MMLPVPVKPAEYRKNRFSFPLVSGYDAHNETRIWVGSMSFCRKGFFADRILLVVFSLGFVVPDAALAEGYSTTDLGPMPSREACMLRSELILQRYLQNDGGLSVQASDWSVYGWDFKPGDQDVVILCPRLEGGSSRALLVVHGETSKRERERTRDVLIEYFNK